MSISAYLQIFNDDDLLEKSLESVKDVIDELVVVDGCYEWMEGYYKSVGMDPLTSRDKTYDILESSKIKYTVVKRVWKNQIEKRIAGFSACNERHIMRIDSDEVINFYENSLEDFLSSEARIANMYMPEMLTPNHIITPLNSVAPIQCFLFDSKHITADIHLHYLWLVLHSDALPTPHQDHKIFDTPIAYNAHLTGWRTADTATNRASYYTINWMRKYGYQELGVKAPADQEFDLNNFFNTRISPQEFRGICAFGEIALGRFQIAENERVLPSPEIINSSEALESSYKNFKKSFENLTSTHISIPFISGKAFFLRLSQLSALKGIAGNTKFRLLKAEATLLEIYPVEPHNSQNELQIDWEDCAININPLKLNDLALSSVLRVKIWTSSPNQIDELTLEP